MRPFEEANCAPGTGLFGSEGERWREPDGEVLRRYALSWVERVV